MGIVLVLIKELQTVAERKKNEAEISTRAFPLESPSNKQFKKKISIVYITVQQNVC